MKLEKAIHQDERTGSIIVYPEIPAGAAGHDILARLTWYLLPTLDWKNQRLIVSSYEPLPESLDYFQYFDPQVSAYYPSLLGRTVEVRGLDPEVLATDYDPTVIFCIDKAQMDGARKLAAALGGLEVLLVDPRTERFESSKYLRFGSDDCRIPPKLLADHKARLKAVRELCNNQVVGIFGTGPSLDHVTPDVFSRCFNIATNSMVINRELMDALKPRIIVASDPIFHAGCSSYAGKFREELIYQLKRQDAYFVFPARDFHIYEYYLTEVRERLIGVPMLAVHDLATQRNAKLDTVEDRYQDVFRMLAINTRMTECFNTVVTNNVMTFFLLPLAASLSSRAIGAGFDGRDPDADEYFWSHAKKSQLNDKMSDIQECHPGFFDVDYNEYYEAHTTILTRQLHALDQQGFEFACITESHMPCLRARHVVDADAFLSKGGAPLANAIVSEDRPKVSVIMPNYNAGVHIERAINSVVAQELEDWELVIVDNGSTDESLEIIQRFAVMDPRIRYVHNPVRGVSASRNLGMQLSRGEYVCFLDSDDELWARSLSSRAAVLDEGAALSFGLAEFINEKNQSLRHTICARRDVTYLDFIKGNPVHTATVMGRRSVICSETFPDHLTNGEDYYYFARLARTGYTYKAVPQRVACYRMHPNSATQKDMLKHNRALGAVYEFLSREAKMHPFFDARFTGGLEPGFFNEQIVRRDFEALVFNVCTGDDAGIFKVRDAINASVAKAESNPDATYRDASLKLRVDQVETVAVRAAAEPKGTRALYKKSVDSLNAAYDVIYEWSQHEDVRGLMADRLRAFIRRATKNVFGDADRVESDIGFRDKMRVRAEAARLEEARRKSKEEAEAAVVAGSVAASPVVPDPVVTDPVVGALQAINKISNGKVQALPRRSSSIMRLSVGKSREKAAGSLASSEPMDMLAPQAIEKWRLIHTSATLDGGKLIISRNGAAYAHCATYPVRNATRGKKRLELEIEQVTHAVDVAVNGIRVAKIEKEGRHELLINMPELEGELSFAPSDGADAEVIIAGLRFLGD